MQDYKNLSYRYRTVRVHTPIFHKVALLSILFAVVFFIILLISSNFAMSNEPLRTQEVVVASGDTLWSIAKDHYTQNGDIREYIFRIRKLNNLDTAQIFPGQVLHLPMN